MLDLEQDLLVTFLVQAINGGGAGLLAFLLWQKIVQWAPSVKKWPADVVRTSVLGTCAVLAVGAFLVLGWLGVIVYPTTPQSWLTTLVAVVGAAFYSSQQLHARVKAKNGT